VEKITPSVASAVKKLMLDLMNSHVAMEEFRSKFQDLLKNDLTGDHLLFLKVCFLILTVFNMIFYFSLPGTYACS